MVRWLLRRLATRRIVVEAGRVMADADETTYGPAVRWGSRWDKTNRGPQ